MERRNPLLSFLNKAPVARLRYVVAVGMVVLIGGGLALALCWGRCCRRPVQAYRSDLAETHYRTHLPLVLRQHRSTVSKPPLIVRSIASWVGLLSLVGGLAFAFKGTGSTRLRLSKVHVHMNRRSISAVVFLITTAVYLFVALGVVGRLPLTGDEPHYMMIAHSLCVDGDVNLSNNHENRAYRAFGHDKLIPHAHDYRGNGALISAHGVGLPLVLLPVYCLFRSVAAVRAWLALLSALAATQIFLLVYEVTSDTKVATIIWAAISFTSPVLVHSSQVYPGVVGALAVIWAVRRIRAGCPRWLDVLSLAMVVAYLPWLHVKFGLISLVLFVTGLFVLRHKKWAALVTVVVPAISAGLFLFYFHSWYGSISPMAGYSFRHSLRWSLKMEHVHKSFIALLFEREYGLIAYSPLYILSFFGLGVLLARRRAGECLAPAIALIYLVTMSPFGYRRGYCFPARHLMVIVPLLSVPLGLFLKYVSKGRWLFSYLALGSLAIAMVMLTVLPKAYFNNDGLTKVPIVMHVQYLFPSIVAGSLWKSTLWGLLLVSGIVAAAIDYDCSTSQT